MDDELSMVWRCENNIYSWKNLDDLIAQGKKMLKSIFGEESFKYGLQIAWKT